MGTQNTKPDQDETANAQTQARIALYSAFWQLMDENSYAELTVARVAEQAKLEERQARLLFSNLAQIASAACKAIDDRVLAQLEQDLKDAGQADIHEKLLEGLIQRFEHYAGKRSQMKKLFQASTTHFSLGLVLGCHLGDVIDRLIYLCGDKSVGLKRILRIKGLCAVVMRTTSKWLEDDSPDLSKTLKTLDQELTKAAEWAVSLRVLHPEEVRADKTVFQEDENAR